MGRKRVDLGPGADARIVGMMSRGDSADVISSALGASKRTIERRMKELRGGVAAARVARRRAAPPKTAQALAPLPDDPDAIPPDAGLTQIDYWLQVAEKEAKAAEVSGETETLVKMVRLATSLLEAKRKATPIPKADPNDTPDFVAAAARVRERWHKLVDKLAAK